MKYKIHVSTKNNYKLRVKTSFRSISEWTKNM